MCMSNNLLTCGGYLNNVLISFLYKHVFLVIAGVPPAMQKLMFKGKAASKVFLAVA